jgi:predicted RNase H-like HicB family nuclease
MPRYWDQTNPQTEEGNPFDIGPSDLKSAVDDLAACTSGLGDKVDTLGDAIRDGVNTIERIVTPPVKLCIETFTPEPYDVRRPIPILIRQIADGYSASLFDANIHTEGETEQEAFDNIRSLLLDVLEVLSKQPEESLGPEPRRQLAVLREFIVPCLPNATAD